MCTTTTPASLGPASAVPANPVSTVVTPPGGVVSFAATSVDLYVDTGTRPGHLHAGRRPGGLVRPALPASPPTRRPRRSSTRRATSTSPRTTASGSTSSRPAGRCCGRSTRRTATRPACSRWVPGSAFRVVVSLVQDPTSSVVLDQSDGSVSGTFPLVDDGFVTQEAGGDLLYSADGYVETVAPRAGCCPRSDRPGSRATASTPDGARSSTTRPRPSRVPTGPSTRPIRSPPWWPPRPTATWWAAPPSGGALDFGGWNLPWSAPPSTTRAAPPFDGSADSISTFSLASVQSYLSAPQAPSDSLGWGAGLATPATGNYFAPGTPPDRGRHVRSVVGGGRLPPGAVVLRRGPASLDAGTVPDPDRAPAADHGDRPGVDPAGAPHGGHPPRAPTRSGPPWWTPAPPRRRPWARPACPTRWVPPVTVWTSPRSPPVRAPAARPTRGAWPSPRSWGSPDCGR